MTRWLRSLALLLAFVLPAAAARAQTVSEPDGATAVASADDFATRSFQDSWDMSQRTDLGWFLHGTDQPASGISNPQFANGVFSGTTTNGDPNFFLVETGNPNAARLGKTGLNYPIDASTYPFLVYRMRVDNPDVTQFVWNRETIYDNTTTVAHNVATTPGWRIYLVDLRTLNRTNVGPNGFAWGGTVKSLRMDPTTRAGETIALDWVRLVAPNASLCRRIEWAGGGPAVDIYLDNDSNPANGTLGRVAVAASSNSASPGCAPAGPGYNLFVGALQPGVRYYVAVANSGAAPSSGNYSSGYYEVNDIPTLRFTSPSEEGSEDDFATTFLGNAWDMNALSDFDLMQNVTGAQITTLNLETEAGESLGSQRVFRATSTNAGAQVGDPYFDPLFVTGRGFTNRIDPTRYRILTFEFGLPDKPRNILNGSIARIVWRVAGQTQESVSDDIIFNSRSGANVLNKMIVDMADRDVLPIEEGSTAGWVRGNAANPGLDIFRVDPHEFSSATPFFIRRIKLAALERANATYTIRWTYSEGAGTVDLYYDTDRQGFDGTLLAAGLDATSGAFTWNTAGLATNPGTPFYIYAVVSDGTNTNRTYARWPVVLDSTWVQRPRIVLNRSVLNFGVTARTVKTPAQTVRVTVVGSGTPCWRVENPLPTIFVVSPTSGCGSGTFTVRLVDQSYVALGVGEATLRVRETVPGTIANSPQTVHAWYRIWAGTGPPTGTVDTPVNGSVVSGSIPVTGWAVDDIDVAAVRVYRDPVAGESGRVYIGDAVRVDDARPDVEAAFSDRPFNYRAGWGYLLLTNFLPSRGTGTFVLRVYAVDREGREALLGSRTIVAQNAAASAPFGAIDTPAQGETIGGPAYNNFGWVLVRGPWRADPPSGGTVFVVIDGVVVGSPSGWTSRSDLTTLFPASSYPGVSKALGVFTFDTRGYANGVHTIAWGVVATNGQAAGVGSRYFTVFNSSSSLTGQANSAGGPDLGQPEGALAGIPLGLQTVHVRRGFSPFGRLTETLPGVRDVAVWHRHYDRIEVHLDKGTGAVFDGYLVKNGRLAALPAGASLDRERGIFTWQPGAGFLGEYRLVFVRTRGDGVRERMPVRIVLEPDSPTRLVNRRNVSRIFAAVQF